MEEELAEAALKLPRAAFVAGRPRWYLIIPVENAEEPSMQFRTLTRDSIKSIAPHGDEHHDAEPPSLKSPRWNRSPWIPQPLVKRGDSPFSERISIGRAPNVDVVIRSPFVSKLHAHFVLRPDNADPTLTDLGSENGTFINNTRLAPRTSATTANGDIVTFGSTHCEIATSDVVYYALRRKYLLLIQPPAG
jgi:hypothetical protein